MAAPTPVSASINPAGTVLTTVWNNALTNHSTATPILNITRLSTTITSTYLSGDGTGTLLWTLSSAVNAPYFVTVDLPAATAKVGAADCIEYLAFACTNYSAKGTVRRVTRTFRAQRR